MAKTVMIVDDSLVAQLQLQEMLYESEYEVVACCDKGEEALRTYDAVHPDLVTMDVVMPGMDGLIVARMLKQQHPEARVLVVSSLECEDTVKEATDLGAVGVVYKPYTREQIMQAMADAFVDKEHSQVL